MRFIHISDLHFNPDNDGRTSRELRESLPEYLRKLNVPVDDLLITGDFRHAKYQSDGQKDIDAVVEYIKLIAKAVKINDLNHIHVVPGNHDRNRLNSARDLNSIRKKYDSQKGLFQQTDLELLLQSFKYFDDVCTTLYGENHYWRNAKVHTYRVISGTVFVYLNTAIMHGSDKDRGRLIIGNDYLDLILREIQETYPQYPIVVLAHHSPDFFEKHEKEAVEHILSKNPKVLLYLCGDAHEAWPRVVNNHLEATAGCLVQEKKVEPTFLYGDTNTNTYIAHHWARAWEPYAAINNEIQVLLSKSQLGVGFLDIHPHNSRAFSLRSLKSMLMGSAQAGFCWVDELIDAEHRGVEIQDSVHQGIACVTFKDDEDFLKSVLPNELFSYLKDMIGKQPNNENALQDVLSGDYDSTWRYALCKKISRYGTRNLLATCRSLLADESVFLVHQKVLFKLIEKEGSRLIECYYHSGRIVREHPYIGLAMITLFALLGADGFRTLLPSPTRAGDFFYALE